MTFLVSGFRCKSLDACENLLIRLLRCASTRQATHPGLTALAAHLCSSAHKTFNFTTATCDCVSSSLSCLLRRRTCDQWLQGHWQWLSFTTLPEIILNAISALYWLWNHRTTMSPPTALVIARFPTKTLTFYIRRWPHMSHASSGRFYVTKNRSYGNHTTE